MRANAWGLEACDKNPDALAFNQQSFQSCLDDKGLKGLENDKEDKDSLVNRMIREHGSECCQQLSCSNPEVISPTCVVVDDRTDDQKGGRFGMAKIVVNPANQFGEGFTHTQRYIQPILYVGQPRRTGHLVFGANGKDIARSQVYPSEEGII